VAITPSGIVERVRRLEALTMALARERLLIGAAQDPMLYRERRAYLAAITDGIQGLDEARIVLVAATHRLEEERG
jgi:hypothetical protein